MPTKPKPAEIVNDSDYERHYPTLGVDLKPGEKFTPPAEKE